MTRCRDWIGALLGVVPMAALAQTPEATLPEITVQSGRLEQRQFDVPGSVHALDAQVLRNGLQVNLSDALQQVPGVVALNRNNYAQDVQISIRGFGARAPFGLRGIRLITDGIPATTPDGQGQASTVSLTSTDRIEVLTGPLAQIYGNASGGVIQTFTREASAQPEFSNQLFVGSYGQTRTDWQLSGRTGRVGIVADYSTFGIDGYRDQSDTRRQQLNSVITLDSQPGTRWKLVVNMFDMPYAKDPLGLREDQLADPSQAGSNALRKNTRKTVKQNQLGLVLEHALDRGLSFTARAYGGTRDNLQFQTVPPPAPAPSTEGSWVGLNRRFNGLGIQLKGRGEIGTTPFDWVAGFDQDSSGEQRQGGPTAAGQMTRAPTRDEWNKASNQDVFAQANWFIADRWTLTTGIRSSTVDLTSRDDYLSDGNGSGTVRYKATSPVLGLTWHVTDQWNVYANQGKGFETPTLSEAAYSSSGGSVTGAFNPSLRAATSLHREVGTKWAPSSLTQMAAAWFHIGTDNDIVSEISSGGKTSYVNATRTVREGVELSARHQWDRHWKTQGSLTSMQAKYDQGYTTSVSGPIPAGNRLPGIPQQQAFASLQWSQRGFGTPGKTPPTGLEVAVDWLARSQIWANDANTFAAPGYGIFNARLKQRFQPAQQLHMEAYLGVDNLSNRAWVGSVIVNQASSQFYEPGLPRSWVVGLQTKMPL
jgi:iron complex outermembrane recepter protein